jgi:glycosyltransferase involved in cell wall biosynthesis
MDSDPLGGFAGAYSLLIENLGKLDTRNRYTIYYPHRVALDNTRLLPNNFRSRVLWPSSSWFQIPVSLPLEVLRRPVDVLHLNTVSPPFCPAPYILTLNDVDFALNPEHYPKPVRVRLSKLVPPSARRARKLLTASEFSKKCIVQFLGIEDERIVVLHQGIHSSYRRIENTEWCEQIRAKYQIRGKFVLYVGKLQARKNVGRLLKAFHILKTERKLEHTLILVGGRSFSFPSIVETIEDLRLQDAVRIQGEVPFDDLIMLYNTADLFVFPSLSEGFGLPPLEAMACGCPVVTSNATAVPEVVGDAALKVDPYNVEELAQAMYDVVSSPGLREDLVARGLKRVRMFSNLGWAEKTLRVYEEVGNGSRSS